MNTPDPAIDPAQTLTPEAVVMMRRARIAFGIVTGITILGLIVVGGTLVYRLTGGGAPSTAAISGAAYSAAALKLPARPRTTLNIGEIRGGTSVTSVPQSASATFDIRSTDANQILSLEVRLYRAVEDAMLSIPRSHRNTLNASITLIGDRPAGELAPNSRLLASIHAADRHLRLRTEERLGSTDANIPLSLGREAVAIGSGGLAGGVHTTNEWHDTRGRDLALRRVLLVLLDLCGYAVTSPAECDDAS